MRKFQRTGKFITKQGFVKNGILFCNGKKEQYRLKNGPNNSGFGWYLLRIWSDSYEVLKIIE